MPSIKAYNTETNKWEDFFSGGSSIMIESSIQSDWNETDPNSKAYIKNKPIIFEETDPTVPAWAKEANKPTYTASEVGAQPKITGTAGQLVGFNSEGNAVAQDLTTETWTFTLEDGSIVTKLVVLK